MLRNYTVSRLRRHPATPSELVVVRRQTTSATGRADVRDCLGHQLDQTFRPPLCARDTPISDDLAQDATITRILRHCVYISRKQEKPV